MTGILITIFLVVVLTYLPKVLKAQRAITPRAGPMPLADRRAAIAARFAQDDDADSDEDDGDRDWNDVRDAPRPVEVTVARTRPARPAGRARYLLDGGRPPGGPDRTRAMMDQFAAPGLCTPRRRRAP